MDYDYCYQPMHQDLGGTTRFSLLGGTHLRYHWGWTQVFVSRLQLSPLLTCLHTALGRSTFK